MINKKYIVFDFNGTIIDDVDLCIKILNIMLINHHHEPVTKEKYLDIFTFPIIDYYKLAGFDFSVDSFEELTQEFILMYQKASLKCMMFPNVVETLDYLNKQGYHLLLLSASQRDNLICQTDAFNITNYFDDILGLDNLHATSKIALAKLYFDEKKINPSDIIIIGDSIHDFEVANNLGTDCILVSQGHQSKKVLAGVNTKIVNNFYELLKIFKDLS